MKRLIAILFAALFFSNQLFARGYNRRGVDGDQLFLLYIALATLLFLIGYAPQIKKYIQQRVLVKKKDY